MTSGLGNTHTNNAGLTRFLPDPAAGFADRRTGTGPHDSAPFRSVLRRESGSGAVIEFPESGIASEDTPASPGVPAGKKHARRASRDAQDDCGKDHTAPAGPADIQPMTIAALAALLLNGGPTALAGVERTADPEAEIGPRAAQPRQPTAPAGTAIPPETDQQSVTLASREPTTGTENSTGNKGLAPNPPHPTGPGLAESGWTSASPDVSQDLSARAGTRSTFAHEQPPTAPIAQPLSANQAPSAQDRPAPGQGTLRALTPAGGPQGITGAKTSAASDEGGSGVGTQNLRRAAQAEDAPAGRAVVAQVAKGLLAVLKKGDAGGNEAVLRLQPRALGDLKIKVSVDGNGIEADFHATTRQARDLLSDSLTHLKAELESRGMTVHRLDVHINQPSQPAADTAQQVHAPPTAPDPFGHGHPTPGGDGGRPPSDQNRDAQPGDGRAEHSDGPPSDEAWARGDEMVHGSARLVDTIA